MENDPRAAPAVLAIFALTYLGIALGRVPGLKVTLTFGCAALLYLVTEELLVEAHEVPETALSTAMFFASFLLLLVIDMLST
jgi:zinc transporter ZupT